MKTIILLYILMIGISGAFGQNRTDSIEVKKSIGNIFRQNGKNLTPRMLLNIMKSNPKAYREMRIAKSNFDAGYAIGFAGGALVGWPIGTALTGGEPNWTFAAVGAGLIAVSIPFSKAYIKHTKSAISIYNLELKQLGINNLDFRIGCTNYGVGISMSF